MAENLPEEELIMKYLDGEMPAREKDEFERRMQTDPALVAEIENLRLAQEALNYYGLQDKVAATGRKWFDSHEKKDQQAKIFFLRKPVRYSLAVAATIVVAFLVVRSIWLSPVSVERIYNDTYVAYSLSETRSADVSKSFVQSAWQKQDYQGMIRYSRQNRLNASDSLLLGLSYLNLNESSAAITVLQSISSQALSPIRQDATFYLALAYLKNKDFKKALSIFEAIHNDKQHIYHEQVTEQSIKDLRRLE